MTTRLMRLVLVAAVLACGWGCAKPDWIQQTVLTEDVTGRWRGTWRGAGGSGDIWLDLRQDGAKVTGELRTTGTDQTIRRDGPIEGRMSGNSFTFHSVRHTLTGELSVSGDSMDGTVVGNVRWATHLRRDSP